MGFLKNLFKTSPKVTTQDEESLSLEWRNRYLTARVGYLSKKLEESGRSFPAFSDLPKDPKARNEALEAQIKLLENII